MTIDFAELMAARLEARPVPTKDQWDAWAAIIAARAPDLAEMLLGDRAGGAS